MPVRGVGDVHQVCLHHLIVSCKPDEPSDLANIVGLYQGSAVVPLIPGTAATEEVTSDKD